METILPRFSCRATKIAERVSGSQGYSPWRILFSGGVMFSQPRPAGRLVPLQENFSSSADWGIDQRE